jgi:hypothetical protein
MRGGRAPSLPGSDDEPAACEAGSGGCEAAPEALLAQGRVGWQALCLLCPAACLPACVTRQINLSLICLSLLTRATTVLLPAVRGEDYCFNFSGKLRDGRFHFRLHMQWEGDGDSGAPAPGGEAGSSKTIDFVYDPDTDTPGEAGCRLAGRLAGRLAVLFRGRAPAANAAGALLGKRAAQQGQGGWPSCVASRQHTQCACCMLGTLTAAAAAPHRLARAVLCCALPPWSAVLCCRRDCCGDQQ